MPPPHFLGYESTILHFEVFAECARQHRVHLHAHDLKCDAGQFVHEGKLDFDVVELSFSAACRFASFANARRQPTEGPPLR